MKHDDEHDFMHGESLGDFLILFEPWTDVSSVDTGAAVVQVMVAFEPSPYVDAASPWHFGYAPQVSYSVTPERTLLRQAGRSDASSSQALWSKPQRFRETFSVSLKRFFWPPLERFPAQSSPYRSCFGRRSSGIRTTCPAHLSCDLISMAWMLSIPACCSTSVSGM